MFKTTAKKAPQERTISESGLKTGTPLTLSVPSKSEDNDDISVFSNFESMVDREEFVISAPMYNGALYPLHEGERATIQYVSERAFFEAEAEVVERVYKDNLEFVRMRSASGIRRIQRRNDFRLDISMVVRIYTPMDGSPSVVRKDIDPMLGMISNLSGGGAALHCSADAEVGGFLQVQLPKEVYGHEKTLVSQIHWLRRDNPASPYRNFMGVRFIFDVLGDKEVLIKYTFEKQREMLRRV